MKKAVISASLALTIYLTACTPSNSSKPWYQVVFDAGNRAKTTTSEETTESIEGETEDSTEGRTESETAASPDKPLLDSLTDGRKNSSGTEDSTDTMLDYVIYDFEKSTSDYKHKSGHTKSFDELTSN